MFLWTIYAAVLVSSMGPWVLRDPFSSILDALSLPGPQF